jgi:type I restriction enzyme S subunit
MAYPTYPDYIASEADWLGMLPSHWKVRRLRFAGLEPLKYGANEAADLEDTELPRYIRITDVNANGSLNSDTFRSLTEEVAAPYLLEEGDILLARSGATVGKSFQYSISWGKAAYAGYLIRFRPDKTTIHPRYAYYYFQTGCYWACINSTLIQATIQNFSAEKYNDLKFPLPSSEEQKQIAEFLDYKTAQIDALIAKKEELIEKLKEQRIAVITQAVTKGLDSDAPMRDSGVEWLGQVPEHWKDIRLRFLCDKIEQGWSPQCLNEPAEEDNWGVVKVGCVNGDRFDASENKALPSDLEPKPQYELKPNDILISRANTRELLGSAAIVPSDVRQKLLLCDKIFRLTTTDVIREDYLTSYLRTPAARYQYEREATGSSGSMQNIGQGTIKNLIVLLPPLEEQQEISSHISHSISQLDARRDKVECAIARLSEYRTALITAATTGKIDVRGANLDRAN